MPEQLSLPGLDVVAAPFKPDVLGSQHGKLLGYTLFLACFPQAEDARRIAQAAADLRGEHGLVGTPVSPGRLHITLHAIGSYSDTVSQADVDAARVAAASVVCPPLRIVFDRVMTFSDSNAFVLRCTASSDAAVARLRQSLQAALRRVGLHPVPSRTAHMTLLYDPHRVAEHPIQPLPWSATRFALILSHLGLAHHQCIQAWDLMGTT